MTSVPSSPSRGRQPEYNDAFYGMRYCAGEGKRMTANPATLRMQPFSFKVQENADTTVVFCIGPLVAEHTEEFKTSLKPLLSKTKRLVIDMAGVNYVDSAGLGAIVSLYTSARAAHCEFKLAHFNDTIAELLRITNLLWLLE